MSDQAELAPNGDPSAVDVERFNALTAAQRDCLRVLCDADPGTDGWTDTWRRSSTFGPTPRVNHNAVERLRRIGLARITYSYSGQQKAAPTELGRTLLANARAAAVARSQEGDRG